MNPGWHRREWLGSVLGWATASLETVQRIAFEFFSAKGEEDVRKVFSAAARTAYRWVPRPQ